VDCGPGHILCNYSSAYSGLNIQLNVSALQLEISRQFNVRYTANLVPNTAHTSSLRYMHCGSGHIQCNYSSRYSGFNIQLNASALLLEIYRQFDMRHTASMVLNTAHILHFTQCELWSRTYTTYLQRRIFRHQYSSESICSDIGDISTIQCVLYCKHGAKHSAHPPVNAIWTVVPAIYNVLTTPHIQTSIFNCTYLRGYWRYIDNSASVILPTWCQYSAHSSVYAVWTVVPDIYNVCRVPHILASILKWTYLRCYSRCIENSMCVILQRWCKYSAHPPDYAMWTVVPDI
jgi:hypothetical protein